MRFVRVDFLSIVAGAIIAACSSFDAGAEPATVSDAGSDASHADVASSSGNPGDAATFTCPPDVSFCDDFTRKDVSDVKGAWSSLQIAADDPPAKIENGAFHLFSLAVAASGATARTYLFRALPDCSSSKVTVDFDFMLEGPPRTANLSVITIEATATTYYISLAFVGANIQLAVGVSGTPQVLEGTTGAPAVGVWTHAQYGIDLSAGTVGAQIGSVPLGPKQADPIADVKNCRFSIGDDFIEPGVATSRWYDSVVANVQR